MSHRGAHAVPRRPDVPSFDLSLVRPSDWRAAGIAVAGAVAVDLAVRSGLFGVAGALAVAVASAGMLASRRVSNPQARAMVVLAPAFGVWLCLRTSPWLLPLDVLAVAGLLAVAASFAAGGSILDLSLGDAIVRGVAGLVHTAATPAFAAAPLTAARRRLGVRAPTGRARAVARGLLMAAPLLILLGVLLASADAVFAGFLRIPTNVSPASAAIHVAALVVGGWGMAALLRVASARPPDRIRGLQARMGRIEAAVVLGSMAGLFAAFAASQLVVLAGGGGHVIQTAGLTYAQYARSRFFQLVAVVVITLAVLVALRAVADLERHRGLLLLAEATVALTLVIVFVAVRRMDLYERAFGLTMLRLYVRWFSLWIGAAFVLVGLALAGVGRRRRWLPAGAGALGLALLLGLNAANPEAVVVRHDVAFARAGNRLDGFYLTGLSEDAWPALVAELPRLGDSTRAFVAFRLCHRPPVPWAGWTAFNLSRHRSNQALAGLCSGQVRGIPAAEPAPGAADQ